MKEYGIVLPEIAMGNENRKRRDIIQLKATKKKKAVCAKKLFFLK